MEKLNETVRLGRLTLTPCHSKLAANPSLRSYGPPASFGSTAHILDARSGYSETKGCKLSIDGVPYTIAVDGVERTVAGLVVTSSALQP
eukprot:scaffold49730_cov36-Phaeocystis_antarctica.AAC.1